MTTPTEETIVTAVAAAFAALLFCLTLFLAPAARLVPLIVLIPTLTVLVVELAADRVTWLGDLLSRLDGLDLYGVRRVRTRGRRPPATPEEHRRSDGERQLIGWILLLLLMTYVLGLLAGLPLYVLWYLRSRSNESWALAIGVAAVLGGVLYGLLVVMLRAYLYQGLIREWLGL